MTAEKQSEYQRAVPVAGGIFAVTFWEDDSAKAEMTIDALTEEMHEIDLKVNAERSDSETNFIHRHGGEAPIVLSDTVFAFFASVVGFCKTTHGLFDVSMGPLVSLWGFDQPIRGEKKNIPSTPEIEKAKKRVGCQKIKLDNEKKSIELEKNMSLDLRFIQHAFALDQAAKVLKEYNIHSAKMTLGEMTYFVGQPAVGSAWVHEVKNPQEPSEKVAKFEVASGAIATLSESVRYFVSDDKRYSDILDPRTGWPAKGVSLVSVWSTTALESAVWAQALFVAGEENGPLLIKPDKKLAGLWLKSSNKGSVQPQDMRIVEVPNVKITSLLPENKQP